MNKLATSANDQLEIARKALSEAKDWSDANRRLAKVGLRIEASGKTAMRLVPLDKASEGDEGFSLNRKLPPELRRGALERRFAALLGGTEPATTASTKSSSSEAAAKTSHRGSAGKQAKPRRSPGKEGPSAKPLPSAEPTFKRTSEVEPGLETAQRATLNLEILPLRAFREIKNDLTLAERKLIAEQAFLLINSLYAHLPLKRANLAAEPVQALRLILNQIGSYESDEAFFLDLIEAFTDLRDLHTLIELPDPQRRFTAFLPFLVGEYFVGEEPHYAVLRISPGFERGTFQPGIEITHWNGTPIAEMVRLTGRQTSGANPSARRRRAVEALTLRPLAFMLPPTEDWVTLSYLAGGIQQEIRLIWQVIVQPPSPMQTAVAASSGVLAENFAGVFDGERIETQLGLDPIGSRIQEARIRLFEAEVREERRVLTSVQTTELKKGREAESLSFGQTYLPGVLSYRIVRGPAGPVGYLRISTFEIQDIRGFLSEVRRILLLLPQNALIVDVRSNPGGTIPAGEGLLQFFSSQKIVPSPLQLRNTLLARQLSETVDFLEPWRRSIELSIETGEEFSQGFPILPAADFNTIGRVYPGKVVLLINATCYSTTDFFAAGWKDNQIGPIIGTDPVTGAGGANVWPFEVVLQLSKDLPGGSPFVPLPKGASMRVAARRSLRVGAAAGLPVEGLGVQADVVRRITWDDLLFEDRDLLAFASQVLAQGVSPRASSSPGSNQEESEVQ